MILRASALANTPGGIADAEQVAEEAFGLLRDGKDRLLRADWLRMRGGLHRARGDISQFAAASAEAYRLVREEAPALSLASHLNNLADSSHRLGRYDTAIAAVFGGFAGSPAGGERSARSCCPVRDGGGLLRRRTGDTGSRIVRGGSLGIDADRQYAVDHLWLCCTPRRFIGDAASRPWRVNGSSGRDTWPGRGGRPIC